MIVANSDRDVETICLTNSVFKPAISYFQEQKSRNIGIHKLSTKEYAKGLFSDQTPY